MSTKKLRWGVIGTAKIAREWVIPAIHASQHAEIVAVASRDRQKAAAFAQAMAVPTAHGSYAELLADPSVDAIYIPLPNDSHVPVSLQAIAAGKHVLCEKPLGLNAQDLQPLLSAAAANPQLIVMEAFMYRFHPQWVRAKQLVDGGVLGDITAVEACFTYFNRQPDNVRNQPGMGGGGLLDIGCYCISAARFLFGREPVRVSGLVDIDPEFQVDRHASGLLDFAPGMGVFYCSTQSNPSQQVKISGTRGTLIVESPFYARQTPARLRLWRDHAEEVIEIGDHNHYVEQIGVFSLAALNGGPAPTPLSDALANIKVIDSIVTSAAKGGWDAIP